MRIETKSSGVSTMRLGRWASVRRTSLTQSVILAVVAVGLAILLSNCNRSSTKPTSSPSSPANNPGVISAATLVYGAGGEPVDLEPALATEWKSSEGGKVWTFKLRSGVKFHDGTDFDASSVKFNVDRWWNPKSEFGYRNAGKTYSIWKNLFGGFKGSPESLLQDVVVEGKDTIKFVLKQPFAIFPTAIACGYFGIASPTAIKKAQANYGTPASFAVGTGPFIFREWRTGDRIVLAKNPNYWKKGRPKSEQLTIRFLTDTAES